MFLLHTRVFLVSCVCVRVLCTPGIFSKKETKLDVFYDDVSTHPETMSYITKKLKKSNTREKERGFVMCFMELRRG